MRCVWRRHYVRFWGDVCKHAHDHSTDKMGDQMSGFIMDFENANDLQLSDDDDSFDGGGEAAVAMRAFGVEFAPGYTGQNAPLHQFQADTSAVEQCNAVVMHVQSEVHVRRPDVKHLSAFPYVTGEHDTDIIHVDWASCSGENICDIILSKFFGSGQGKSKSMAYYALALLRHFNVRFSTSLYGPSIKSILTNDRGLLQDKQFPGLLRNMLAVEEFLRSAKNFLLSHERTHPLHVISATFFPKVPQSTLPIHT